ncbi:MAG: helix-turn-helix domain-containing protein [Actinobacteria bacterium]|nr:helix-turn-helix domain-containing protein [Actinomycetota bacterium]
MTSTPQLHPLADAAERLAVSMPKLRRMAADGDIATVRIGRRRYVTDDELRRFIDSLTEQEAS